MKNKLTQRLAIAGIATAAVVGVAIASPALASNNKNHVSTASVKSAQKSSVSTPAPSASGTPNPSATPLPWQGGANGSQGDNHGDGPRGGNGFGPGFGHGFGHGFGPGLGKDKGGKFGAPVSKTVTVDVPADGKTYELVVTEVPPVNTLALPIGVSLPAPHSFTVAVTGTGSQDVTVKVPHAGDYTVDLVAVSSTQKVTF